MSNEKNKVSNEDLKKVIRAQMRDELKTTMQEWEESAGTRKELPNYQSYLLAASIVMILALVSFWYLFFQNENSGNQIAEFMQAPELLVNPIERGDQDDLILSYWNAYTNKDYYGQISAFTQLPDSLQTREEYLFYLAIAQWQEERYPEAIRGFKSISESGTLFKQDAKWFLALATYQQSGKKTALPIIETILEEKGNKYQKDAKILLDELE